jgi:hypothetical protein
MKLYNEKKYVAQKIYFKIYYLIFQVAIKINNNINNYYLELFFTYNIKENYTFFYTYSLHTYLELINHQNKEENSFIILC